ncbi:MAG TPA: hypothetical protein VN018_09465 [Brevundimonas sp.]|nr:hypothetical protein [Brevundimonas sp.]
MYDTGLNAIGLLVENGRTLTPLNRRGGDGNFYLQPNGVFAVDRSGRTRVIDSAAWSGVAAERC